MSEALNIWENIAEIKGLINEMRNTFYGMNSRMVETEEWVNDLEDRVLQSNKLNKREKNNYEKWE